MASVKRIPTPFIQHVRRFRLQALPILVFIGLLAMISVLWTRNLGSGGGWISGQVMASAVNIYSTYDGILMPVALTRSASADMLAEVDKDDVVARIDPRKLDQEIAALRAQLDTLKSEIYAAEAQLDLDANVRADDHAGLVRQLSLDAERMELEVLDRKTSLAADQVEAMRTEAEFLRAQAAGRDGLENDYLLESRRHMRDYFRNQVEGQSTALAKAEQQLEKTRARLGQMIAVQPADIRTETVLAPIRHSIAAQAALVRSMEIQRDMLEITSPIRGRITAVYFQPGQAVRSGDILMTITGEYSDEVIAYVRENQRLKLSRGQNVILRSHYDPKRQTTGVVTRVGRSVEAIPTRQLRSPDQPEWGLPVCIDIDKPASGLLPGEKLDIAAARQPKQ